ncbi:MAG TPA: fumarate hydratase [Methanothrix soehngenii]|mgnify:FL=1|nr:fumarate hydratase [Methanothrix soehngenii]
MGENQMITSSQVTDATVRALYRAETSLPPWVLERIKEGLERETNPLARSQLQFMLDNVSLAGSRGLPICQDTGLAIFHVQMGQDLHLDFDLQEAIAQGVRRATSQIPLRPNAVDPVTRENSKDNTGPGMPDIILDRTCGQSLSITAFPKGAGSENMSLVMMLNPADDPMEFIVDAVRERAANACPPLFLGIGIGGSFDLAARLAKHALFNMHRIQPYSRESSQRANRCITHNSSPEEIKKLEENLMKRLNSLGIGPMGLGGDTTVLGLRIEKALCHTASLPVAINFQCWANRSATEVIL